MIKSAFLLLSANCLASFSLKNFLITGIFIIASFTLFRGLLNDNFQYFLSKSGNYGLEDGIGFKYSYGKRFGILLLAAYAPYILTRSLLTLKTTKLNFLSTA